MPYMLDFIAFEPKKVEMTLKGHQQFSVNW